MTKSKIVKEVEELAQKPVERRVGVEFLDSGSTHLNLAISGRATEGGWPRSHINNVVGDGGTAKTLTQLEMLALAFYSLKNKKSTLFPKVTDLLLVYNNVEGVMDFPLEEMYGQEFVDAIEWIQTPIAEDFGKDYQQRVQALKSGQCLIYVVDSLDALVPQAAADRMTDILSDRKPAGSYGAEKAKFFSSGFFSHLCGLMQGKDATLFCVSQVRENIGVMFGEKHYRTGGKALNFYTHVVCWLAQTGKLEKTAHGQRRIYGISIKARIKRNKVARPFREAEFDVVFDYGLDNVNSMINFLFGQKAKTIEWEGKTLARNEFVDLLDDSPADLQKMQALMEETWLKIEDAVQPKRKKRFV